MVGIVTFGASWTLRVLVFTFRGFDYNCYYESSFFENLIFKRSILYRLLNNPS